MNEVALQGTCKMAICKLLLRAFKRSQRAAHHTSPHVTRQYTTIQNQHSTVPHCTSHRVVMQRSARSLCKTRQHAARDVSARHAMCGSCTCSCSHRVLKILRVLLPCPVAINPLLLLLFYFFSLFPQDSRRLSIHPVCGLENSVV